LLLNPKKGTKMRVISLINGSLISETSSVYSFYYAKQLRYTPLLVYIEGKDSLSDVKKSVKELKGIGEKLGLDVEFKTFENIGEFKKFVEKGDVDIVFASTRHNHTILDKSFIKTILNRKIEVDFAVVKVIKSGIADAVDKIILPIRDSKLSIRKFIFFSVLNLAYKSEGEVYSINKVSPFEFKNSIKYIQKRTKEIFFNLRHYFRFAKIAGFNFSIKADIAIAEEGKVETHIAKHNFNLAIVGAHHSKIFFGKHPIDVLFEKPIINTIYFIPYKG
jgi:hypothetical protein